MSQPESRILSVSLFSPLYSDVMSRFVDSNFRASRIYNYDSFNKFVSNNFILSGALFNLESPDLKELFGLVDSYYPKIPKVGFCISDINIKLDDSKKYDFQKILRVDFINDVYTLPSNDLEDAINIFNK